MLQTIILKYNFVVANTRLMLKTTKEKNFKSGLTINPRPSRFAAKDRVKVSLTLLDEAAEQLDYIAKKRGVCKSDIVTDLIMEFLT